MAAAPQERWTILAAIPNVLKDEEARRIFPWGTYISVAFNDLPGISVLTVPHCLSSPPVNCHYPYINAVDQSGLLLLSAKRSIYGCLTRTSYKLCDAHTGDVISLREHRGTMSFHGNNIGLIVRGQCCMVAELQPKRPGDGRAKLLVYSVGDHKWVERELVYSPPIQGRHWFGEGVVSYGGMLWWINLYYGLLACDPFADEPELLYVSLPRALDKLPVEGRGNYGAYTCVKVSGGKLMCVQIHGSPEVPVVSTWALADPASAGEWNPERSVCLADILV